MLNFLKGFLKINQFFGTSVANCYKHKNANLILLTLSCIHSILSLSLILILIIFRKSFIGATTPSSIVNEYLQFLSPLVVYSISVFESLYFRKKETTIWLNIQKCEKLCDVLQKDDNQTLNRIYKIVYMILFALYTIIPCIPEMYNLVALPQPLIPWKRSYMIRLWPFMMTRFNHLHYLLYITFLKNKLEFITSQLTRRRSNKDYDTIRKIHLLCWKICFDVSKRFGISETANLLNHFLIVFVATYWIFIRLVYSWSPFVCKNILLFKSET